MKMLCRVAKLCLIAFFAFHAVGHAADTLISPDQINFPPLQFNPPAAKRVVLENGIVLFVIEDHEIPLVRLSAVLRAGSNYDPAGKEGLSDMTAALLRTGGISSMSGNSVDQEIDFRAAEISFSTTMEACSAYLSMHKKDTESIMQLFSGMLKTPMFEEAKLTTAKNLMTESLSRIRDDQQRFASREFRKLIYAGNPRGSLPTIASIRGITRNDLIAFHQRYFTPENLRIAISGDITTEESIRLIKRHLGAWKPSSLNSNPLPDIPLPHPAARSKIYVMNKETPQSTVMVGFVVAGKENRDFYPLSVLDFILGSGGFRSRITQEIRNERGLAYSAGSIYAARAQFGILQAYAMTKSNSTEQAASLIKKIVGDLRDRPVSDGELQWAKRALVNRHIFTLESLHQIAFQQLMLEFDKLPTDFLTGYIARISKVSAQDIRQAALQYLEDGHALVFIMGDEKKFTLSRLGETMHIDWTE